MRRLKGEDFVHTDYSQILVVFVTRLFLDSTNNAKQLLCAEHYTKFFHTYEFVFLNLQNNSKMYYLSMAVQLITLKRCGLKS